MSSSEARRRRRLAKRLQVQVVDGVGVLERSFVPDGNCDQCGAHKELRPYGPNGTWVCFSCAMKDEAGTAKRYREHVFGDREQ